MKYTPSILAVLVSLSTSSFAQDYTSSVCNVPHVPPVPSTASWLEIRAFLSPQLEHCLNNSDYFSLYGASLLFTGKVSSAIEMLERALLINPNNAEAKVDYAQALYLDGQLLAALQVNQQLLEQASLPEQIRALLEQRRDTWEQKKHIWRNQISFIGGHSSNLNNATYIDSVNLTPPSGTVVLNENNLIINEADKAISGPYQYLRVASQYYSLEQDGVSLLSFAARTRESELNRSDTDELSIRYVKDSEGREVDTQWSFELEHVRLGDDGLYSSSEAKVRLQPKNSNLYFNIDGRFTHFNNNSSLDEFTTTVGPGVAYTIGESVVGLELNLGINHALEHRAGGNRAFQESSVFYNFNLAKGRVMTKLSYSSTEDYEGYSPLLNNFENRSTASWSAVMQYLYPITSNLTLQSSYYYRDQNSNIAIFKTQNESLDIGLTYTF